MIYVIYAMAILNLFCALSFFYSLVKDLKVPSKVPFNSFMLGANLFIAQKLFEISMIPTMGA